MRSFLAFVHRPKIGSPAKLITASKPSNALRQNRPPSGSQKIWPGVLRSGSPRLRQTTIDPWRWKKERTSEPINPEEPDKRMRNVSIARIYFYCMSNEDSLGCKSKNHRNICCKGMYGIFLAYSYCMSTGNSLSCKSKGHRNLYGKRMCDKVRKVCSSLYTSV